VLVHTCNPSIQEVKEDHQFQVSLGYTVTPVQKKKKEKNI
jgi:hypothetical protein